MQEAVDIACGKGITAVHLARKYGCRVAGVDIEVDFIEPAIRLAGIGFYEETAAAHFPGSGFIGVRILYSKYPDL